MFLGDKRRGSGESFGGQGSEERPHWVLRVKNQREFGQVGGWPGRGSPSRGLALGLTGSAGRTRMAAAASRFSGGSHWCSRRGRRGKGRGNRVATTTAPRPRCTNATARRISTSRRRAESPPRASSSSVRAAGSTGPGGGGCGSGRRGSGGGRGGGSSNRGRRSGGCKATTTTSRCRCVHAAPSWIVDPPLSARLGTHTAPMPRGRSRSGKRRGRSSSTGSKWDGLTEAGQVGWRPRAIHPPIPARTKPRS